MNLGAAFGYNNSHTDFDTDSSDDSDTDTYMAAVTGSHNVGDKVYQIVDWTVGAGRANTESKRLASNGLTAHSEFDSDLLFGEVSYSVPMAFYGWYFLPKTTLAWTNIDSDGYTESGAGSENLKMGDSRADIFTAKLGSSFSRPIQLQSGVMTPYFSVRGDYDLKNDAPKVSGGLASSSTVIAGKGESSERFGMNLGMGLAYTSSDRNHTFAVDYKTYRKEDYKDDTAALTYAYKF